MDGRYIGFMNSRNDNQVQSASATGPAQEQVAPSLGRPTARPAATTPRNVMDTLLGNNRLAAIDGSGGDPYNATGRQFRR
jgi:hypothetical protein